MRYKFKAWDKHNNKWIHKEPCDILGETILFGEWMNGVKLSDLNNIVILQYTGMNDIDDKPIFEGDIIKHVGIDSYGTGLPNDTFKTDELSVIAWDDKACAYMAKDVTGITNYDLMMHDIESSKVIGNIYDSPDIWQPKDGRAG